MTDAVLRARPHESSSSLRDFAFGRRFGGRPYLISPLADFLCAGGGGFILLLFFVIWYPSGQGSTVSRELVLQVSLIFSVLSYFVNYPHFMASYELLYANLGRRMGAFNPGQLMWWRYVNAAFIVPVVLVIIFAVLIWRKDYETLAMSIHLMFFFVGWHYVKQSYGVFVVLSGMKGVYYAPWQALLLRIHSYSLWFYVWYRSGTVIGADATAQATNYWGLHYKPLVIYKTADLVEVAMYGALACGIAAYLAILWQWYATRKRPSITALAGYASMYPLFAFARFHPLFSYAAPMFHSLQYMLFVYAYKRGEWKTEGLHEVEQQGAQSRKSALFLKGLNYFLVMAAIGAIGFDVLPHYFETKGPRWGITIPGMFLFHLFINTHHYFIDNVIWRRDNKDVGRNLFAR